MDVKMKNECIKALQDTRKKIGSRVEKSHYMSYPICFALDDIKVSDNAKTILCNKSPVISNMFINRLANRKGDK